MLIAALVASGIGAIVGYFYFRPPRLRPLSDEGLRNAIKIAIRQQQHDTE